MDSKMLVVRFLITFAPLIQSCSSTMKDAKFTELARAANIVYSDYLLFDSPARSKLSCLELCAVSDCCVRFTYTGERGAAGRCRGHSTQLFPSHQGINTTGAATYVWMSLRQVSGEATNAALNKVATQSSTIRGDTASKANDGDLATSCGNGTCAHTDVISDKASWWQVDLGADVSEYDIISVVITNRIDCCTHQPSDFDLLVYNDDPATDPAASGALCFHYDGQMAAGMTEELACSGGPVRGRFVRLRNTPGTSLTLCEVQVMAVPAE